MNDYDLKLYKKEDHELVETFLILEENEHIDLEIQDLEGNPHLEENGDKVIVQLEKKDLEQFLRIMRKNQESFNQIIVQALEAAIEFDKKS